MKYFLFSILILALFVIPTHAAYNPPPGSGQAPLCPDGYPGCNPPIDSSATPQIKDGGLSILGLFRALTGMVVGGAANETPSPNLLLDVEGKVGATDYCDKDGNNCTKAGNLGGFKNIWYADTNSVFLPNNKLTASSNGTLTLRGNGITFAHNAVDADGDGVSEPGLILSVTGGGVQGPQGPQGPVGPQGPPGQDGNGAGTVTKVKASKGLKAWTIGGSPLSNDEITSSGQIGLQNCSTDGQVLKYDATSKSWNCASDIGGGASDNLGNHVAGQALKMGTQNIEFHNGGTGAQYNWITQDTTAADALIIQSPKLRLKVGGATGAIGASGQVLTVSGGNGDAVWSDPFASMRISGPYSADDANNDGLPGTLSASLSKKFCFLTRVNAHVTDKNPQCLIGKGGAGTVPPFDWTLSAYYADCQMYCFD